MTNIRERQELRAWSKVLHRYDSILSKIEHSFTIIASVLLFVMIFMVSYSVIGRSFFSLSGAWAVELSEYIMLYLTFLLAPWILKESGHVRITIFLDLLSLRAHSILNVVTTVAAAIVWLVLCWFSIEVTISSYQRGVVLTKILQVPEYILLTVIPLGSLFLFLRTIYQLLKRFVYTGREEDQIHDSRPPEI